MLTLFGNAFSPFSRKVQLVLEYKRVDYEMVDGLSRANHDRLAEVNQRLEVPASMGIEREKIFWRGDRIEWILARGHHEWFVKEIEEGRVLWPKLGIPVSTKKS